MRALGVALTALALLHTLLWLTRGRRWAAVAAGAAAAASAGAGGYLAGCSPRGSIVLAASIAAEAPLWVLATGKWRPPLVLTGLATALGLRFITAGLWSYRVRRCWTGGPAPRRSARS